MVDDLAAATEFFAEIGLVLHGEAPVEGRWVDRIVGLEGVRADTAMMQTPDGNGRLELVKFHSPPNQGDNRHAPASTPGIRHIAFAVKHIDGVAIRKGHDVLTLVNVFTVKPEDQKRLMDLFIESTERTVKHLPGFVSANIHRSLDGTKVVNYAQWRSKHDFDVMRQNPERGTSAHGSCRRDRHFDPILCEVAEPMDAGE